jgi:hypothetical protein
MEHEEQYYPMPQHRQDDSNRTTKWKVDPEDVISEIGHNLRGDVFNEYDQEWTVNDGTNPKLCNEKGTKAFTAYLRSFLNKNVILSNYRDDEIIRKIAMEAALTVNDLIYTRYDAFEIDKEDCRSILLMIDNNIYATLLRAKDGFFTNHLSTTQRYIEQSNVTTQDRETKKKFMGNPFNWKGNEEMQ